jgi:hypothetical protein
MAASKLSVYNDALLHLGETRLASLTEARSPRRALDEAWDDGVEYCLEQGLWNFAARSIRADSSTSIDPTFGFTYAFAKPEDWIRTVVVANNDQFNPPMRGREYNDEGGYWYANCDPLYVRYVSSDNTYGLDLSLWPQTFSTYVSTHLARRTCKRITGSDGGMKDLWQLEKKARVDARSKDAMNEGVGEMPRGSWSRSRSGYGVRSANQEIG